MKIDFVREQTPFLLLIGGYIALALLFLWVTPPLETPDAYYQFAMIEYIDRNGNLPHEISIEEAQLATYGQFAYHAPLYYFIGSLIIRPIDTSDFLDSFHLNPHAQIGEPSATNNHNFVAYTRKKLKDSFLAMQVIRLWSITLGSVTLTAIYVLARTLFPSRQNIALLAVAVVAFNPQFLFITSAINNDNLVMALSTLIIALTVLCIRYTLSWQLLIVLSILLALNSIAKASGLVLYPIVAIACIYVCWRDHVTARRVLLYASIGILTFLIIAGWWYINNWIHYGDLTASSWVARATGLRSGTVDWTSELRGAYLSFWGLFGWFNVLAPDIFYIWTILLVGLAIIGLCLSWQKIDRDSTFIIVLFFVYTVLFFLSWMSFNVQVMAGQGRLFFPLIGVIACSIALGLSRWRWGKLMLLPMLLACITLPFLLIQPIYNGQASISKADWSIPSDMNYALIREPWSEVACLRMWMTNPQVSDTEIIVDIAWEPLCPITGLWSVFIHYVDPIIENCVDNSHVLSQYDTMPDGGRKTFPSMQINHVLLDQIHINVPDEAVHDSSVIHIGLYDAGGTFIRAFIDSYSPEISIGSCAPELIVLQFN